MSFVRLKRALPAIAALVFGDRLLLRHGRYDALARALRVPPLAYRPHPYMLYELNPNWTSSDGKTHHNSLGFRGREVAPRKRPGCVRIVCMGESTTYCTGIADDRDTYPARLEAHLRALHPNRDIEVVNAGIGGFTSIENLLRFHFHVAPLTPDLVIYYYTHNDFRAGVPCGATTLAASCAVLPRMPKGSIATMLRPIRPMPSGPISRRLP